MRGYFEEEKVFIRKVKDGKPGFVVLAPFITSISPSGNVNINGAQNFGRNGIMVSLGWVPAEHVKEIEAGSEPLPVIELAESTENYDEPFTNMPYYSVFDEETFSPPPYTEVTGIIRAGETFNPLIGNVNFERERNWNFIDLNYFSKFFTFENPRNSTVAYLERVVESLEDEDAEVYPIPATKDSFPAKSLGQETYSGLSNFTGFLSAGGFAAIIPLLLL